MWRHQLSLLLLSASSLLAQNGVVPAGIGSIVGSGFDSDRWDAEKARFVMLIDAAQFPWGRGNPGVLNGIRLRRVGSIINEMAGGQRTIRIEVSATQDVLFHDLGSTTPIGPTANTPSLLFAANHGAAVPTLVRTGPSGFPFLSRIPLFYQGFALPFTHTLPFSAPFPVPPDADTLVIDIEVDNPAGTPNDPLWWPDAHAGTVIGGQNVREFVGGFRQIGAPCASTCQDFGGGQDACLGRCRAQGMHLGGQFQTELRVGAGDVPTIGWIGQILPAALPIPGFACTYQVDPAVCLGLGLSGSTDTSVVKDWFTIPNIGLLLGMRFGAQFAALSASVHPSGAGVSAAYEVTIGPAPSGRAQFATIAAACDGCNPVTDPHLPAAIGTAAATPVLELF